MRGEGRGCDGSYRAGVKSNLRKFCAANPQKSRKNDRKRHTLQPHINQYEYLYTSLADSCPDIYGNNLIRVYIRGWTEIKTSNTNTLTDYYNKRGGLCRFVWK